MSIRAIVLDYGGVLARSPVPDDFRPVADEIGLTWEMYREGFAQYRLAYDSDQLTCADMYRKIAANNGLAMTDDQCERLCRADDESWLHPIPETLAWMKELKSSGCRIGILTNMATKFFDRFVSRVFAEHIALADALVVSGKAGVSKPDARIYRMLEGQIGVSPEQILFFDDNPLNVQGAKSCGWNAAIFTSIAGAGATFATFSQTFHVREQNPSGCWGFAHRSSLHSRFRRVGSFA